MTSNFKSIKSFLGLERKVSLTKKTYENLLHKAGNEDDVEFFAEQILSRHFEKEAKKVLKQKKQEQQEKELIEESKVLDAYLYSTLNRTINIGITNALIGHERSYVLKDYKIDMKYKIIRLEMERNGEAFPIEFREIWDIKYSLNGDVLKTWIYMSNITWRFYLVYDQEILNKPINSGRLEL